MSHLPEIEITTSLREMLPDVWNALALANSTSPSTFKFGENIARVEKDGQSKEYIRILTPEMLILELDRRMQFMKYLEKKEKWAPTRVPRYIVEAVLSEAYERNPLPIIDRIVRVPVFSSDGHVVTEEGYCSKSRVFYIPESGLKVPKVSQNPPSEEILKAKELIFGNLLCDFPFVSESDRAHAFAMLLNPCIRALINGPTPLYLITAPTTGTGKTKLTVNSLSIWVSDISPFSLSAREEEAAKELYGYLRRGREIILIDNLKHRLTSASFEAILTTRHYSSRVLGVSECPSVPVFQTFVVTGNNPRLGSEIAERSVPVRLDRGSERPSNYEGFKHHILEEWVNENRSNLIWAALTLVQKWIAQGKKPGDKVNNRFPVWSRVVGGILEANDIRGFLDSASVIEFREDSDEEDESLAAFVQMWHEKFKTQEVFAKDLVSFAILCGIVRDNETVSFEQQCLETGQYLGRIKGRVCNGLRVAKRLYEKGRRKWALEQLPPTPVDK